MKNGALKHALESQRGLHFATNDITENGCVFLEVFLQLAANQIKIGAACLKHRIGAAIVK